MTLASPPVMSNSKSMRVAPPKALETINLQIQMLACPCILNVKGWLATMQCESAAANRDTPSMDHSNCRRWSLDFGFAFLSAAVLAASPAQADPVADFYRGKTVHILIGVNVGGGYDMEARLVARFLGKTYPGNPTVVPQNMIGAGGIKMANYLYAVAPQDGTAIGMFPNTLIAAQAVGISGVQYDANRFLWLGSMSISPLTFGVWHTAGVRSWRTPAPRRWSPPLPIPAPSPTRSRGCSTRCSGRRSGSFPDTRAIPL